MNMIKPAVLSFSLLAFAGAAYAQAMKSQESQQAQPSKQSQQSQQSQQAKPSQQPQQSQATQSAQSTKQSDSASAGASGPSSTEIMASKLNDAKVVDSQGKDIGEISEVVIDLQKDRVHAVVLEFGGFMGLGAKQFAFPMSELKPGKGENQFVANVDKQKLESREGFAKGKMPGMDDQYWSRVGAQQVSAGGGQQASSSGGQPGQKFNLVQASKMIGSTVQDKSGKEIGEIKDVVLSVTDGQLKNLVIEVKDAGEARVPAKGLSSGTGDKLVLDMTSDQVRAQAKKTDRRAERDTGAATGATTGTAPATTPGTTTRGQGTPAPAGAGTQERPAQAQERGSAK